MDFIYMINRRSIVIALFLISTPACGQMSGSPEGVSQSPELVLARGARLQAHTSSGSITVIAGDGLERRYEWDGCGLNANMVARTKRWLGSLGIYDAAGAFIYSLPSGCHGISRTVVQEGQIHFAEEGAANAWISKYKQDFTSVVWTSDGLLVAWATRPQRYQLSVDVYQICIRGRRPVHLAGAVDDAVQISESARVACARVADSVIAETQEAWSDLQLQLQILDDARKQAESRK